ncbi:MAG: IPTL-CTERM sorting domain-containing protein [Deltaproteobacteria bacterium]|nr:IPTL-CTERM sorting domain-containing protein [Deltaproteobacteria bacterium]
MRQIGRSLSVVTAVLAILAFMASPASAATPPFLGPPNMHANTIPGSVDVGDATQQAYPQSAGGSNFYLQSPWSNCQPAASLTIQAQSTGAVAGKYDRFSSLGRTFLVDQFSGGYPIGGTYANPFKPGEVGTLMLEKSVAGQATFDQVHLVGTKRSGPVDVILSLAERDGYIGVTNLASLGVINTCGGADANSQILLPLGTGDHGQPAIVLDINGDGIPDPEFLQGPPISGLPLAPAIPTLTEWGLIVMTLILLIVGLRFLRNNASPASA